MSNVYKLMDSMSPEILKELVPQTTRRKTSYPPLRSACTILLMKARRQILYDAFFPILLSGSKSFRTVQSSLHV